MKVRRPPQFVLQPEDDEPTIPSMRVPKWPSLHSSYPALWVSGTLSMVALVFAGLGWVLASPLLGAVACLFVFAGMIQSFASS